MMYKLYKIATMHHLCLMTPESAFRTQLGDILSPGPQQRSYQALFKFKLKKNNFDSVRTGRYKNWAWWLMYLQLFSPCDHVRCPLRTYLSQTVHHAFTKRSPCAHRSFSVQLLFSQIVWFLDRQQYIQVVYVNLFLITDETQCKEAHLSVVHLAFPQRSHIVYCAFTVHFVCALALRLLSAFLHRSQYIWAHQILFSMRSLFT